MQNDTEISLLVQKFWQCRIDGCKVVNLAKGGGRSVTNRATASNLAIRTHIVAMMSWLFELTQQAWLSD